MSLPAPADVAFISGRRSNEPCGVWDYAERLHREIKQSLDGAELQNASDWSIAGTMRTLWRLSRSRGIVHLQHPSRPFERHLGPYLTLLACPNAIRIVTMHEFSRKSRLGKQLSRLLFGPAHLVIFTSEQERQAACAAFPRLAWKFEVVPIASNIPGCGDKPRLTDLAYFGQIRAGKGIEAFLDAIEQLRHRNLQVSFIGQSVRPLPRLSAVLLARAHSLGVRVILDASPEAVAEELAATKIAMLPFPDGMSERRGSALAAMLNGALVLTTAPKRDAAQFSPLCLMVDEPEDLARAADDALARFGAYDAMRSRARAYAEARSWPALGHAHLDHYQRQLANMRASGATSRARRFSFRQLKGEARPAVVEPSLPGEHAGETSGAPADVGVAQLQNVEHGPTRRNSVTQGETPATGP